MFGLFKSKKDKKAEQLVKEIREEISMYYDGNVVYELGSIILNRYKLTVSTFETVRTAGLLPGLNGSGSIAAAISKSEILFITFEPDTQSTKIQLAKYPKNMLEDVKKNLVIDNDIAKDKEGAIYPNDGGIFSFIGAVTLLGYEVGIGKEEDNSYPFNYKNNKFLIEEYDGRIWIMYLD